MPLSFTPAPIPLTPDENGVIRVGGTRVTLDTVAAAFLEGATAEEIVQRYPSVLLADVYSAIAYYLRHPSDVDAYLQQRRAHAETVRRQTESHTAPREIRRRLLARRDGQGG